MTVDRAAAAGPDPSPGAEDIPSPRHSPSSPRPEILARVLDRLRDMPPERPPRDGAGDSRPGDSRPGDSGPEAPLPLPRRRS